MWRRTLVGAAVVVKRNGPYHPFAVQRGQGQGTVHGVTTVPQKPHIKMLSRVSPPFPALPRGPSSLLRSTSRNEEMAANNRYAVLPLPETLPRSARSLGWKTVKPDATSSARLAANSYGKNTLPLYLHTTPSGRSWDGAKGNQFRNKYTIFPKRGRALSLSLSLAVGRFAFA